MRRRELGYFIALSVALHAALAVAWWRPALNWKPQFAAPELLVSLSTGTPRAAFNAKPDAAPKTPLPRTVPAAPQPEYEIAEPEQEATTAVASTEANVAAKSPSDERARENHLLSQLHYALDRHFLYPSLARRYGWEGRVLVKLRLDPDGKLIPLTVVDSSGYAMLDRDAVATLARIGVVPEVREQLHGRAFETDLPIIYRLTDG